MELLPAGDSCPPQFQRINPPHLSPSFGNLGPKGVQEVIKSLEKCTVQHIDFICLRSGASQTYLGKRSLNKRHQPSQCKNKYQSSGHSASCAATQVPSAAPNNYKSVQREWVGVSERVRGGGGEGWVRWSGVQKSEFQTIGQGRGATLREAPGTRGDSARGALSPHTLTAEFVLGRVKK